MAPNWFDSTAMARSSGVTIRLMSPSSVGGVTVRAELRQDDEVVAVNDFVGGAVGEVGGAAAGEAGQRRRPDPDEALGEHDAVGAGELDGVVGGETTVDPDDARWQERHVALAQRL